MVYIPDLITPDGTDQTSDIQAVLDAHTAGPVFDFGPGGYRCDGSLDLAQRIDGFMLAGGSYASPAIISHAAGRAVVDLVGSRWFTVRDFWVQGDDEDAPEAAFLSARTATHPNADNAAYIRVGLRGTFTVAGWYLIDSEVITVDGCRTMTLDAPFVYYTSERNDHALASFATIDDVTIDSTTSHYLSNLYFHTIPGIDGTAIRFSSNNVSSIRDSYWTARGTGYGIQIADSIQALELSNIHQEGGSPVLLRIESDKIVSRLSMRNCSQATRLIEMDTGAILHRSNVDTSLSNAVDAVGLDLYDVDESFIGRWWNVPTAKLAAHNITGSDVWLPGTYDQHTIAGYIRRNQWRFPNIPPVVTTNVSYSVRLGEHVIIASGAGTVITIPENAPINTQLAIRRIDAVNAITVQCTGSDTIGTAASLTLHNKLRCVTVVSDGWNWHLIGTETR